MFCIIRHLRASRSISRLCNLSDNFENLHVTNQWSWLKGLPNHNCRFEVRPKRLFSSEAHPNQDPLSDCDAIYPLNNVQIEELTGNDPQEVRKLKILQMELAVRTVQHPHAMPARIRLEQWRNLLCLSRTAQLKYLLVVKKKEERYTSKIVPDCEDDTSEYDTMESGDGIFDHRLFRNAMFPMLHPNTMNNALNSRLANAIQFSPTLVVDCGFEAIMSVREIKNLCQQLALCVNVNRTSRQPFNLFFNNLKKDSVLANTLWAAIPNIFEDQMPLLTSESCYTELFPKDKLVYLTPHCRETVQFNPSDIYIMGAMVDKSNPGPHSLIKAKAQGIRMGSFPLDKFLVWKKGTKSLTLDQVVTVMVKMNQTRNWADAFNAIPKRKISDVMAYRGFDKKQRTFEF